MVGVGEGEDIQTTRIDGLGWQKCDAVLCRIGRSN